MKMENIEKVIEVQIEKNGNKKIEKVIRSPNKEKIGIEN